MLLENLLYETHFSSFRLSIYSNLAAKCQNRARNFRLKYFSEGKHTHTHTQTCTRAPYFREHFWHIQSDSQETDAILEVFLHQSINRGLVEELWTKQLIMLIDHAKRKQIKPILPVSLWERDSREEKKKKKKTKKRDILIKLVELTLQRKTLTFTYIFTITRSIDTLACWMT